MAKLFQLNMAVLGLMCPDPAGVNACPLQPSVAAPILGYSLPQFQAFLPNVRGQSKSMSTQAL